jgi:hypothetical protein
MFHVYDFSFDEVRPSKEVLMRYLQIKDDADYALVENTVEYVFNQVADSKDITGGYTLTNCESVDAHEGRIVCSNGTLTPGKRISRYMGHSSRIAMFICTAGGIFTELSHSFQSNNDFLEAFVVESIGSATVENAMDKIQMELRTEVEAAGEKITNRYSPGYCEWPLTGQKPLFDMIGVNPVGISLSESCLMQPIKSVSGIIGIGKNVKEYPYGCAICGSKTCVYRKIIHR